MSADPFAAPTREVERDRYGRPLIRPADGGKPVAYMRATTLAGSLEDTFNLSRWQCRMVATGLIDRPDLALAVAAHRDDKKRLDAICEDALEAAKGHAAATTGTALHSLTEQLDRGQAPASVPEAYRADLDAYTAATRDLNHILIEQMMVLDDLKVAGTPDRVVEYQGKRYIADLKTGSIQWGIGKIACQLALYAHALPYDTETGTRGDPHGADLNNAIVIHLPAGTGTCTLHWVNIKAGWEAVQLATQVRAWRTTKNLSQAIA